MADYRHPAFLAHRICVAVALLWIGSCGGSSSPNPDFTFAVSPTSVTVGQGSISEAVMTGASALNGFSGSVTVTLSGLPPGATTQPAFPLQVVACSGDANMMVDCAQSHPSQFTITTTDATPLGSVTLTLRATSGSLAHDATLTLVTAPLVQTSQQGTVLYLQSRANGHTARIGLDTAWGGAIVEASMDGNNFVNAHDTGREVQPALYDGADQYPWPNMTTAYGWDPVLGGDSLNQGSPVLSQELGATSIYTKTTPLQWNPAHYGGGIGAPIPTDMTFEQTVTVAPGTTAAFLVHYKLTHTGADTHYNTTQEFPAVYVNSAYTSFEYYGGTSPWTNGNVTIASAATNPSGYAPEQSAALVDVNNQGLTVFVPGVYPYWSASWPAQTGGGGPTGDATVYMTPTTTFTITPGQVIEGDVYLIPGDAVAARATVYTLHQSLSESSIVTPEVTVDVPVANATISGAAAAIAGWAFGKSAVSSVRIYVDGALSGSAILGDARPDVAAAYPNLAPTNCGWNYALDTTGLVNGTHSIVVHAVDASHNEAVVTPLSVTVNN
jgi:hypothetical protein